MSQRCLSENVVVDGILNVSTTINEMRINLDEHGLLSFL